jgi:hypothetical protein
MRTRRKGPKKKKRQKSERHNKTVPKKKPTAKKYLSRKKQLSRKKKHVRGRSETVDTVVFEPKGLGARSGGQSGDLQGLSGIERAGSESVEELVEEGNAFEAEIVKGVEDASYADEEEVTTHEVSEDDVPEEYRDEK